MSFLELIRGIVNLFLSITSVLSVGTGEGSLLLVGTAGLLLANFTLVKGYVLGNGPPVRATHAGSRATGTPRLAER